MWSTFPNTWKLLIKHSWNHSQQITTWHPDRPNENLYGIVRSKRQPPTPDRPRKTFQDINFSKSQHASPDCQEQTFTQSSKANLRFKKQTVKLKPWRHRPKLTCASGSARSNRLRTHPKTCYTWSSGQNLCEIVRRKPSNPDPYRFLIFVSEIVQSEPVHAFPDRRH